MNSQDVSRKDFLRTAGSVALFAALGISFSACSSPTSPEADPTPNPPPPSGSNGITVNGNTVTINLNTSNTERLKSSGGWLLIEGAQVIVVNVDGSTIRAFSSVCTHQGCATNWAFSSGLFECTCHGSRFNTSGQVVRGPAASNLPEYSVSRNGDTVTITKS